MGGAHPLSRITCKSSEFPFQAAQWTAVQPSSPARFRSFLDDLFKMATFPSLAACAVASGAGAWDIFPSAQRAVPRLAALLVSY